MVFPLKMVIFHSKNTWFIGSRARRLTSQDGWEVPWTMVTPILKLDLWLNISFDLLEYSGNKLDHLNFEVSWILKV